MADQSCGGLPLPLRAAEWSPSFFVVSPAVRPRADAAADAGVSSRAMFPVKQLRPMVPGCPNRRTPSGGPSRSRVPPASVGGKLSRVPRVAGESQRFSFLIPLGAGKLLNVGRERRCHGGNLGDASIRVPPGRSSAGRRRRRRQCRVIPPNHEAAVSGPGAALSVVVIDVDPARLGSTTRRRYLPGRMDRAVLALGAVYVERFSECFTGNIAGAGDAG